MSDPLLQVTGLSYLLSGHRLLDDVSFSVQPGELIGIIGPNGAGKSTLLRALVQYLTPSNGDVAINGISLKSLSHIERAKSISYLAQHPSTSFAFSVRETIALGAHHQGAAALSPSYLTKNTNEIAARLSIEHLLDRKLTELSGGETQLVHFARILMQQAPLMLLDEPTASLDIGHESQLMNDLRRQCRSGSSALVAIHNLNIAGAFCERLLLLDNGKLVADGRPEDVITQVNMNTLYHQQVMVSKHPISGSVTVLPRPEISHKKNLRVHLIGGAGSAVALTRSLLQMGVTVTGGVCHLQDSDADFWSISGVEHVSVPAFSEIDATALQKTKQLSETADIVILCHFPVGPMNSANLQLAKHADSLWVVDDSSKAESGRFYSDSDLRVFNDIKKKADVMTTLMAIERLNQRILS